jgi:hypothetical protein
LPLTLLPAATRLAKPPITALSLRPPSAAAFAFSSHPGRDAFSCPRSAGHLASPATQAATYGHFARHPIVPPTTACPRPVTLCVDVRRVEYCPLCARGPLHAATGTLSPTSHQTASPPALFRLDTLRLSTALFSLTHLNHSHRSSQSLLHAFDVHRQVANSTPGCDLDCGLLIASSDPLHPPQSHHDRFEPNILPTVAVDELPVAWFS